ncbi:MAG: helix-turn-helix domain-containing protein [Rikenellaceae bacterium]
MGRMTKRGGQPRVNVVSFDELKDYFNDVVTLSDDLLIATLNANSNPTAQEAISSNCYMSLILAEGEAEISIDMVTHKLKKNDIFGFLPGNIVKTVSASPDIKVYLVAYSKKFVRDVHIDLTTSMAVYMSVKRNPVLSVEPHDVEEIVQLFNLISTMIKSDKEIYRSMIVRTLFTAMFYIMLDLYKSRSGEKDGRGRGEVVFDEFMLLLQRYSARERNVKFYAAKLNFSTKYLSAIIKNLSGKSAARWIDDAVIREAKRRLIYTGDSVYEIACGLNFSNQSFFGRYFKHHVGMTPSEFRKSQKE